MIFRGDGGRELLGDTLKARGAQVEYVTCYLRSKPDVDVNSLLKVLPHAITVTSSEALNHLREMLDEAQRRVVCGITLLVPHAYCRSGKAIGLAAGDCHRIRG
jgi:uroporphyrinogen-III synthase